MTRAGTLNHRGDILSLQGSGTGTRGQTQKTFLPKYSDVAASIVTLSGRELEIARQTVPSATHQIELYWQAGVTAKMRFAFKTRSFSIGHVNNVDEMNETLILTTTEEQ